MNIVNNDTTFVQEIETSVECGEKLIKISWKWPKSKEDWLNIDKNNSRKILIKLDENC